MTGEIDPLRVAAELRDMPLHPSHGGCAIPDEHRETHLRDQSIIGNDDHEPARCQRPANEAIFSAISGYPTAAVKKHDDRMRRLRRSFRNPDVELQSRIAAKGDTGCGQPGAV